MVTLFVQLNMALMSAHFAILVTEIKKHHHSKKALLVIVTGVLYYISSDTQTWTNARSKCQSMGGDLVTMTTAEENAHVKSLLSSASSADYWMGLTDISLEGDWMYVDGSRPTFPDWDPGEPSGDGDCNTFRVSESYRWNDIGCGYSRRYVCKTPGKLVD